MEVHRRTPSEMPARMWRRTTVGSGAGVERHALEPVLQGDDLPRGIGMVAHVVTSLGN